MKKKINTAITKNKRLIRTFNQSIFNKDGMYNKERHIKLVDFIHKTD